MASLRTILSVLLGAMAIAGCGAPDAGPTVHAASADVVGDDDDDDDTTAPSDAPKAKTPATTATTPLPAPASGPDLSFGTALAKTTPENPSDRVSSKTNAPCMGQWFEKLRIDVVTDAAGRTKSFRLSADWQEKEGTCQAVTVNPSGTVALAFTTQTPLDQPVALVSSGTVKVEASADVAVDPEKRIGRVTLRFHRTDATAPKDWLFSQQYALAAE